MLSVLYAECYIQALLSVIMQNVVMLIILTIGRHWFKILLTKTYLITFRHKILYVKLNVSLWLYLL
jgi:hypothetical protein